jgi:hypothetical protein
VVNNKALRNFTFYISDGATEGVEDRGGNS